MKIANQISNQTYKQAATTNNPKRKKKRKKKGEG
jgi:hypothetical protein